MQATAAHRSGTSLEGLELRFVESGADEDRGDQADRPVGDGPKMQDHVALEMPLRRPPRKRRLGVERRRLEQVHGRQRVPEDLGAPPQMPLTAERRLRDRPQMHSHPALAGSASDIGLGLAGPVDGVTHGVGAAARPLPSGSGGDLVASGSSTSTPLAIGFVGSGRHRRMVGPQTSPTGPGGESQRRDHAGETSAGRPRSNARATARTPRRRFYTPGMDSNPDATERPRLDPVEIRVLGTLVEKAHTVASQYPMTLNAIVAGASQRSNRDPVEEHDESSVLDALDRLRAKGFVHEVNLAGSRVPKYRHVAREALEVSTGELVVLTELLLRGPQTVGELRARASRMHPLESTEVVSNLLRSLRERDQPLVERLPPAPGTRAERFRQRLGAAAAVRRDDAVAGVPDETTATGPRGDGAADRSEEPPALEELRHRVATLERRLDALESSLGSSAPHEGA